MTKLFKSTLMAALVSLLISAAHAEQAPISIRGKITEFRGYVMHGLTVTARDNSTGREYQAVSDDKGFFSFEGSMVARLKLKGIDGRAPPGVDYAA